MTHFNFVISQNAKWGHDVVSKLTTDVVTYCTEASNQKSKYAYRKKLFYKKALGRITVVTTVFYSFPIVIRLFAKGSQRNTRWSETCAAKHSGCLEI